MDRLAPTLNQIRSRITSAGARGLNEENTKAALIEPFMRTLGWNVGEVEEVPHEFKVKSSDTPIDLGLFVLRGMRLFLGAKVFGSGLGNRRWANQIMASTGLAGAESIVLTNREEHRISALRDKLLPKLIPRELRVSDADESTQGAIS